MPVTFALHIARARDSLLRKFLTAQLLLLFARWVYFLRQVLYGWQ
jgi:hypothetical protein